MNVGKRKRGRFTEGRQEDGIADVKEVEQFIQRLVRGQSEFNQSSIRFSQVRQSVPLYPDIEVGLTVQL